MFASRTWRRWTLLVVGLALLAPATIFPGQKHKKKDKNKLPEGIPVLWRAPSDVSHRDLYWGPGGKGLQPDLRRVTLIEKEKGGYSTKYRVRDASGREWIAKVGKEAKGETAASRLMWAAGYLPDVNYLVPSVYVEGLNKKLENARFSLRPANVKRVEGWKWKQNPFVGTREFQGMKVMMALLNNWDIKDSNNKVAVVSNERTNGKELHYFVGDLGASFGKVSHLPRILQFKPDRNNPKAYGETRLVNKVKEGQVVDLHYRSKKKELFRNVSVEDAQWITGWLSRLSDRQIEDAFRAANYSPSEVRLMTRGVRNRINELSGVRNTLASRKRNHHR
jgi:hypothetical protein